jgi:hypothetical protein
VNRFIKWLSSVKKELADTYCRKESNIDNIINLPHGISGVQNSKEDDKEKTRRAKTVEDGVRLGSRFIS